MMSLVWIGGGVALVVTVTAVVAALYWRRRYTRQHRDRVALAVMLQRDVEPYLLRRCEEKGLETSGVSRDVVGRDIDEIVAHLGHLAGALTASERRKLGHADTVEFGQVDTVDSVDLATSDTLPIDVEDLEG